MENNEILKKILLNLTYDSKKTLSENEQRLKPILLEYKKGGKSLGNWCADSDYNLGSPGKDYVLKKGSCFKPKTDAGPNAWAYCSSDPWETDDPLIFDCSRKNPIAGAPKSSYLWEPEGAGNFWDKGLNWGGRKLYYNNQLENALKAHFCTVPTTTTTVKVNVGGGGTGDDKIVTKYPTTNMARNSKKYWRALFDNLEKAGYTVRTGGKEIDDADQFQIGKFVIRRDVNPFICLDCEPYDPEKKSTYVYGNMTAQMATPNKYSGEADLNNVKLLCVNTEKERMSLIDFLALGDSKSFVKDKTGGKIDTTGGKKTGGGGTGGKVGTTSVGWKSCSGTYSYGCKSPEVGEAQRCLGIYADNKFGGKTLNTIKRKLGKTSFTDNDLKNIICKKPGGGGESGYDFDKEDVGSETEVSQGPQSFTGTVY